MLKTFHNDDQDSLVESLGGQGAILFEDSTCIKSAASEVFSKSELAKYAPDKNHFGVHLVAMGDHEHYGWNRNGDTFTKEALQKYHKTFETDAHLFREHRNRDPKKNIGFVKAAKYNEHLGRVELIVHGDKKKASDLFELVKEGKESSFSMSCKLPYDRCSCCDKKSKKLPDYCDHLRNSMNKYVPEMKKYAYAFNDKPTFFDISHVDRPADRTAHYLEYLGEDGIRKAASNGPIVIPGMAWADFYYGMEKTANTGMSNDTWQLLNELAEEESQMYRAVAGDMSMEKSAFMGLTLPGLMSSGLMDIGNALPTARIKVIRMVRPGTLFNKLAHGGSILPFDNFMSYATGRSMEDIEDDVEMKAAKGLLPFIYRLLKSFGGECTCGCDPEEAIGQFSASTDKATYCDNKCTDEVQQILDAVEDKVSMKTKPVKEKVITITITKSASENIGMLEDKLMTARLVSTPNVNKYAEVYALYKMAAIQDIIDCAKEGEVDPDLLKTLAIGQNYFG